MKTVSAVLTVLGLMLVGCAGLSNGTKAYVVNAADSFIDEGACYLEGRFGPDVKHSVSFEYVAADQTVVLTKTTLTNPNGHLIDLWMLMKCDPTCESKHLTCVEPCSVLGARVIMDPLIKQREIPTPPSENCEGM